MTREFDHLGVAQRWQPWTMIPVFAICALGALIRIPPLYHDFWLDEAWSYLLVQERVTAPLDILTNLRIDNNHPLNSLFLYLAGDSRDWPFYRIPAWTAGVGCVPLTGVIMRRFGTLHALCSMLLVAASYPLIVYSTEARGYAPMLLCALLSVEGIARWLELRHWTACIVFWTAVVLGFLSHLTFVHCYGAVFVVTVQELHRQSRNTAALLRGLALAHGVPLIALSVYYWSFVRRLVIGGAEPTSLVDTLVETTSLAVGAPAAGPISVIAAVGAPVLLLFGLRGARASWRSFFLFGIVIVPLATAGLQILIRPAPVPLFPRYFLTSIILFQLLLGCLMGDLLQGSRQGRMATVVLMALILTGNAYHTSRFIATGRGRYLEAIRYLAEREGSNTIRIASNSDFRTMVLLSFYGRLLPAGKQITYYSQHDDRSSRMAEWWIIEILDPDVRAPAELTTPFARWALQRQFPFYGPSGCSWAIYQRSPAAEEESTIP